MGVASSTPGIKLPLPGSRTDDDLFNRIKVTPTSESLAVRECELRCPVMSCEDEVTRFNTLSHHIKLHIRELWDIKGDLQVDFHCPKDGCQFSLYQKTFNRMKYLKQHYQKVHLAKTFSCHNCSSSFGTQPLLSVHQNTCGNVYECSCKKTYKSLATLKRHTIIKSHQFNIPISSEKAVKENLQLSNKTKVSRLLLPSVDSKSSEPTPFSSNQQSQLLEGSGLFPLNQPRKEQSQMPMIVVLTPIFNQVFVSEQSCQTLEFGTQTVPQSRRVSKSQDSQTDQSTTGAGITEGTSTCTPSRIKRKRSAETQTRRVRVRISAETQTTVVTKRRRCNRKKLSTQTQTQVVTIQSSVKTKTDNLPTVTSISTGTSPDNISPSSQQPHDENEKIFQNQFDLFNELEEVHSQTQTEPDLLLGENFDFTDLDGEDVSEILRYVESKSAETQTQNLSRPNFEQTVPTSSSPYSPSSDLSFLFPEDGDRTETELFESFLGSECDTGEPVANAYLTMDSETQTQFSTFPKHVLE